MLAGLSSEIMIMNEVRPVSKAGRFPQLHLLLGAGVGWVETLHLPGLWLGREHVLKGKGIKAAEGGAWGVIIVTDHRI